MGSVLFNRQMRLFGIFRLGAYVDVALVLCALFLIVRLGARMPRTIGDAL